LTLREVRWVLKEKTINGMRGMPKATGEVQKEDELLAQERSDEGWLGDKHRGEKYQ